MKFPPGYPWLKHLTEKQKRALVHAAVAALDASKK